MIRGRLTGILLPLILCVLFLGCREKESADIPDALVGVWRAPETKYEDRFFEITRIMFNLGVGGDRIRVNYIRHVQKEMRGNKIQFTFLCENLAGMQDRISLYYNPAGGGVIKLKNPSNIEWRKD